MVNHLANYHNLSSPNAKRIALRAQLIAIEEEMQNLYDASVRCTKCDYLMTFDDYYKRKQALSQTIDTEDGKCKKSVMCPCCDNTMTIQGDRK